MPHALTAFNSAIRAAGIYRCAAQGKGNAGGNSMAIRPDGTIWATGGGGAVGQLNLRRASSGFFQSL
jgi:hypothetical protein